VNASKPRGIGGLLRLMARGATCIGQSQLGTEWYDFVISVMPDVGASQPRNSGPSAPVLRNILLVHSKVRFIRCDVGATTEHDA
jgi:hypothetical protein